LQERSATLTTLEGDEQSGAILRILDEDAAGGTEKYRALIDVMREAGLNVYPRNSAGHEYDRYEYHPAGGEVIEREISPWPGAPVISASELLEECRPSASGAGELAELDDATLGPAAKRALTDPQLAAALWAAES
jgi:hypothetical protein